MKQFNVGDKVTLLSFESLCKFYPGFQDISEFDYVEEMKDFFGKELTIRKISNDYYYLKEDDNYFEWYYKYFKENLYPSKLTPFYVKDLNCWQVVNICEETIEGILFDTKEDCEKWINSKLEIK